MHQLLDKLHNSVDQLAYQARNSGCQPLSIELKFDELKEVLQIAKRYERIRKLSPQQYRELWLKNLATNTGFDTLVDELPNV